MEVSKHQGWLFTFAAMGGLGGFACFLQFIAWLYELKPGDMRGYMHIGWPGWMWLVGGLVLFFMSIVLSLYSLRINLNTRGATRAEAERWKNECERSTKQHANEIDRLTKKHADEISALRIEHEKHAAALIKQGVPPSRQEQAGVLFPSLSALHDQKPQINFNAKEYFRTAYISPVTAELEQNIKIVAHQYDSENPEIFYARLIGIGATAYHHDLTWALIFKSQLDLLAELNRVAKRVSIAVASKYYDDVVGENSDIYPKYEFDGWLGYIQSRSLVFRHPSDTKDIPDTIEITHAGRDFLKFLAHWGRDVTTKKA